MAMAMWVSDPNGYSTSASAATNTTSSVWPIWCNHITGGTSSAMTDNVWHTWSTNNTGTGTFTSPTVRMPAGVFREEFTPEELAAKAAKQAEYEEEQKKKEEERKAAAEKAMDLLREHLNAKQRKALDKHGWFLVEGGKSKKTYRIHNKSISGNITEMDGKKDVARYCVHADHKIPMGDQLLTQMLHLRHDEEFILGKANRTQIAA